LKLFIKDKLSILKELENIYPDGIIKFNYNSYIVNESNLFEGTKRLLQVDKPLFLPINAGIRFLISSSDVLHAWAVPKLGLKIDAVPGRLNQFLTFMTHPGIFYGQCSELCGMAHGFMPVNLIASPCIEVVKLNSNDINSSLISVLTMLNPTEFYRGNNSEYKAGFLKDERDMLAIERRFRMRKEFEKKYGVQRPFPLFTAYNKAYNFISEKYIRPYCKLITSLLGIKKCPFCE